MDKIPALLQRWEATRKTLHLFIHRFSYGSFRAQLLTILAFFVMGRLSEALLVFSRANSLRADAVGAEGTLAEDTAAFLRFILPDGLYNNVRIGGLAYVSIVGIHNFMDTHDVACGKKKNSVLKHSDPANWTVPGVDTFLHTTYKVYKSLFGASRVHCQEKPRPRPTPAPPGPHWPEAFGWQL